MVEYQNEFGVKIRQKSMQLGQGPIRARDEKNITAAACCGDKLWGRSTRRKGEEPLQHVDVISPEQGPNDHGGRVLLYTRGQRARGRGR